MKKLVRSLVLAAAITAMAAVPALAASGGMPAAHGVDGKAFGGAVSGLVTDPMTRGIFVSHVSGR